MLIIIMFRVLDGDIDIIVAGGGLSGLLAAKEASSYGASVKVLEADREVGLPEKCDGLVSINGLRELGIIPQIRMVQSHIKRAILHSPNGTMIEIDASKKGVVVIDRSEFDLSLAKSFVLSGGNIELGQKVTSIHPISSGVEVESRKHLSKCKVFIDSRGIASLAEIRRDGLLQAAKYIVTGKEFAEDTVELFFNQDLTPSFFTWLIPAGDEFAKLGCAGNVINGFSILDRYVKSLKLKPVRKIASSIYVGGPLERFVNGAIVNVGDAAGQTKPTTAGGIYSGGMGGVLAGRIAAKAINEGDLEILHNYEKEWRKKFQREFESTAIARRIFERLDNKAINKTFSLVAKLGIQNTIAEEGDFDFHAEILPKILRSKDIMRLLGTLATSEIRRFVTASKKIAKR